MYKVVFTPHFTKQLKPYLKKFRHILEDVKKELSNFDRERAIVLGELTYKIRLKSSDLPRGKSKSFRLIVFLIEYERYIAPIAIYFKGDKEDIEKKEIEYHLLTVIKEVEDILTLKN